MCIIYSSVHERHTRYQSKVFAKNTTCYNIRDPYVFPAQIVFHVIIITSNERLFL